MKYKSGFTLIELLVVISIIGLLASVVLASLSGARPSATPSPFLAKMLRSSLANEYYSGIIDDFPIYHRSISTAEIYETYARGVLKHGIALK